MCAGPNFPGAMVLGPKVRPSVREVIDGNDGNRGNEGMSQSQAPGVRKVPADTRCKGYTDQGIMIPQN